MRFEKIDSRSRELNNEAGEVRCLNPQTSNLTPYNICKDEFGQIHVKLDKLDESIRGNGKPGILVRLDRLEQKEAKRNKFVWIVVGAIISACVVMFFKQG